MLVRTGLGIAFAAMTLAVAPAASATTFPIGTIPNFYISSGTPFSKSITAIFGNGFNTQTPFDDSFTFTIPFYSGVGSGSLSTSFSSPVNHLTISQLYINGTLYSVPSTASGQSVTVGGIPIAAGVLNTIRIVGTSGPAGGSYSGTATFSATVPETATWAMMLGGFALMGTVLRRRQVKLGYVN